MTPGLIIQDWRAVSRERVAPLYAEETARWASVLDWDAAAGLQDVERGRTLGHVRGFIVSNSKTGALEGWCYYIVRGAALQIGGFVTRSEECSELMLNAIFTDEGTENAETITFFAFSDAPGLAPSLRRRGLAVDRYWYYKSDLAGMAPHATARDARRWRADDAPAAVNLLMQAYAAADESRPFAPRGSVEEWTEYLRQLMEADGCGQLIPDACISVPLGPGRLAGVALVSRISPNTAHLVQLAVEPGSQRQGLGASMLMAVCGAARRAGFGRLTMMVSGKNSKARALYQGAGFVGVASFVAGGAIQPLRLTSVASGGVAATRR
jgi:ribosomal protein S18 acetylase RimI-like enzyme